ncbi:MAG TPA: SIMPL domain-containing protein, partial [Ktedonobacterales bacterium]|nr:SIMPL domain-containing protein [Ktedonobacterales bacterium]
MSLSSGMSRLMLAVITVFAVLAIIAITLGLVNVARAETVSVLPMTSQQTGINVCGHGTAQVKPDRARISAGVRVQASTAQGARDHAASSMTAVINALKSNGAASDDIQTGYVSIEPQYDYNGGAPRTIGYVASNSVNVTVRNVAAVSKLVDAVTAAGGNSVFVSGVSFSSSDPSAAASQAQQKALADAKNQASHIAHDAGVNLGAPISIQVGGCGNSSPVPYMSAGAGATDKSVASTPIQPGQQD